MGIFKIDVVSVRGVERVVQLVLAALSNTSEGEWSARGVWKPLPMRHPPTSWAQQWADLPSPGPRKPSAHTQLSHMYTGYYQPKAEQTSLALGGSPMHTCDDDAYALPFWSLQPLVTKGWRLQSIVHMRDGHACTVQRWYASSLHQLMRTLAAPLVSVFAWNIFFTYVEPDVFK